MDVIKTQQISARSIEKVIVHPLVLLSIVDHYNRVARDTKKRVVGVLLGASFRGTVDVTNSYAVPFEEDDKDPSIWFLDHNYHESMFSMFRRINAKEHVVGWYSTGPKLRENDLNIHGLFNDYVPNPVLVIIDVQPKEMGIPTKAYYAVEEVKENATQKSQKVFVHVPSEIAAHDVQKLLFCCLILLLSSVLFLTVTVRSPIFKAVPRKRFHNVVVKNGLGLTVACMAMSSATGCPADETNLTGVGEIRLIPDLSTKCIIPWAKQGMVLGDMHLKPGEAWEYCPREALRRVSKILKDEFNLVLYAGFESEFYLLKSALREGKEEWFSFDTMPYCSASAFDAASPVLHEVVAALQSLNIAVEQVEGDKYCRSFFVLELWEVVLRRSNFEYKFFVDGEWRHDEHQPFVSGNYGVVNIVFLAREPNVIPAIYTPETPGRSSMDVDNDPFLHFLGANYLTKAFVIQVGLVDKN